MFTSPFPSLLLALSFCTLAQGADFVVTNNQDAGSGSLRAALASSRNNGQADTITFANSLANEVIVLTSDELQISSEVTITGFPTASLTISGNLQRRVFDLSGEAIVTMNNLTVSDGFTDGASGIANSGTLTLNNCTLRNHRGGAGAALRNFGGSLTMNDCLIEDNLSDDDAAVNSFGSGPNLINRCQFINNRSDRNGGALATFGPFTLRDSTFEDNYAGLNGAGLVNGNVLDIINCTFLNNEALITGGGIDNRGTLNAINCTFDGNTAASGAAVVARFGANLINCTLADNNATGLSNITELSQTQIVNGINGAEGFANNSNLSSIGSAGGLLTLASGNFSTANTIFSNNTPQQVFAQESTTLILNGNNLSSDNSFSNVSNLINSNNLIANTSAQLAPLANNGGEVLTRALLPNSPAIDAGDNATIFNAPLDVPNDARGFNRILLGAVDLGAVEFTPQASIPEVDLTVTFNNAEQPLLSIEGAPNARYQVFGSMDLDFSNSQPLLTLELDQNGQGSFTDTQTPLPDAQFYRLEFLPPSS